MAGDLTKWSEPDVPLADGNRLKFKRKGGCFVTKKVFIILLIIFLLLLVIAIYLTKVLTEKQYEPNAEEILSNDSENPLLIRLPEDIIPNHYQLALKPYLDIAPINSDRFSLSGVVIIFFTIIKPTSTILLNYEGNNVHCKRVSVDDKLMIINTQKYDDNINIYSIELETNLEVGKNYSMQLTFNNTIGDEQIGFYRNRYLTSSNNKERWIGITQLEPIYARRMFPCFDEPNFRTTFDISVHRLRNVSILSNTNKKSSITDPDNTAWIWDHFERTPAMPTHKLSIVIGDFTVSKVVGSTQLSLWTRAELRNEALNSINLIKYLLDFYQSYFSLSQPIKKIDFVAVPDYATENSAPWGLILFSESLLYKKNQLNGEAEFALEISKKLAEQWLGNLVSINWWTDLMAKNSLTTYMAYLALNELSKEKSLSHIKPSLTFDALQKGLDIESYPVTNGIRILSDIRDTWSDSSSAYKGACLLSTITSIFLPSNELRDSVKNYLEKWSEKPVNRDELWKSFNSVEKDGIDLMKFINNWEKPGYPLVNVNYDKKSGEVRIHQEPFYLQHPPSDRLTWDIPLSYTTSEKLLNGNPQSLWLKSNETTIRFILKLNESWILVNLPQRFYRVNYDLENWKSLENDLLENDEIDMDEIKAQLIDDSFQLAKSGRLSYEIPFNLTLNILNSMSLIELRTIDIHLKFLRPYFQKNANHQSLFKNFTQNIFQPLLSVVNTTGNPNDNLNKNYFRSIVLYWNCKYDEPNCINWAQNTFKSWITDEEYLIESTLADIVFCTGIRLGNSEDFYTVLNRSLTGHRLPREKITLLKSLTCSRNISLIINLLDNTVQMGNRNKELILSSFNKEQIANVWRTLSDNLYLSEDILKFVRKNWIILYEQYHKDNKVIESIIKGFTEGLTEENHLTEVVSMNNELIKVNKLPPKSLQSAINRLIVKTAWRNTKLLTVIKLFENYQTE